MIQIIFYQRLLAENQIAASIGPDDIKLRVGFDTVRRRSVFGVDMLIGSDRAGIEFDKMRVIDPGNLSKSEPKENQEEKSLSNKAREKQPRKLSLLTRRELRTQNRFKRRRNKRWPLKSPKSKKASSNTYPLTEKT